MSPADGPQNHGDSLWLSDARLGQINR